MKDKIKSGLPIAGFVLLFVTVWAISMAQRPDDYPITNTLDTPATESIEAEAGAYESTHGSDACTRDCSGHEAGYQWANENDICDPYYDRGNSQSFNEGVIAWAYDNCYYGDGDEPI